MDKTKCDQQLYTGWTDVFECTDPYSWAYSGIYLCLGLSIIGAGM